MSGLVTIGLGFLEGAALFVSPCILPVLPIVLSTSIEGGRLRPYGIILGFAMSFTLFTLFSRQLVLWLGLDPNVLRQVSFLLLLAIGLVLLSSRLSNLFSLWTQRFSQWGHQINQRLETRKQLLSGVLIGCCIGLIWVPCSGPILAAVLVQSIQQHTNLEGFLTVLAFALGAGVPMLIVAIGGTQMMERLQFFKRHGDWIRKATGVIIILTVLFTAQDTFFPLFGHAKSPEKAATQYRLEDSLPQPYPAPPLVGIQAWINTKPIDLKALRGKVVLIDFWTYSCINCVRTLPYLKAWDAKYRKDGLVVIGIHAPEFEFERNLANVQHAVEKEGIRYPVALDSNLLTWQSFHNQYWPAHYLIDKQGNVVYTHFGEGRYDITENNIRALLGVKSGSMASHVSTPAYNFSQSPETYLGFARGERFTSPQGLQVNKTLVFTFPQYIGSDQWALEGKWQVQSQFIEAKEGNARLRFHFNAKNVYLVLGTDSHQRQVPLTIFLNGKAVRKLTVTNHTLYTLLSLPRPQDGLLEIKTDTPGLEAYAFTFG